MHFRTVYVPLILALFFCPDFAENGEKSDPDSLVLTRRAIFLGPVLSYNARDGRIDISDIQESVPVHRGGLLTLGLAGGLQVPISRMICLQIGLSVDGGSATDDTLFTAETVSVRNFYYHAGLEPQVRIAPWQSRNLTPFVAAGIGVNGVWVQEHTFLLSNPGQEILYTDRHYVNDIGVSFDLSAGLGCEVAVGKRVSILLTDFFRYLYPVSYEIRQDFPLFEMPYREALCGNVFFAGISMRIR
jgi:hypothetical protein